MYDISCLQVCKGGNPFAVYLWGVTEEAVHMRSIKGFSEKFQEYISGKFSGKHLCQSPFFNKVVGP